MKPKLLVFGSGGHACSVIDVIQSQGRYEVFGLIDSYKESGQIVFGFPVVGNESNLPEIYRSENIQGIVIAVGDNYARMQLHQKIISMVPDASFPIVIHSSAVVSPNATLRQGSVVMPGSIINSKSVIEEFCIINTNSVVEHECVIGSYASIGPSSCLGGCVSVQSRSAVMLGTTVAHKIEIGQDSVIGAGTVVIRNIPSRVIVVGSPGKILRERQVGERYL